MHIQHLLLALLVERENLVAGWCVDGLLEVGAQTLPCTSSLLADRVLLVDILGLFGSLVLLVKLLKS